jgi:tetratricopeptide (TPR) repeat protein
VLDDILLRIQLVGGDATSAEFLESVGAQSLSSDQRKRLVLKDPANRGRYEVAGHLLQAGQPGRALIALTPQALPNPAEGAEPILEVLSPSLKLLRARALGDLGRYAEASAVWIELLDNPVLGPEALVYLVEAQLGSGQAEALELIVTRLLDALANLTPEGRAASLRVADHLLAGGQPALAERLLEGMDGVTHLRGGDILERMALGAAQRGDTQALELILERAEAFLSNGGAEIIRILYAIENRLWPQLPTLVASLRASDYEPSEFANTILSLLEERLEAGQEQARSAALTHPQSGRWALVQGASQSLMDSKIFLSDSMGKAGNADMALFLRGTEGARQDPRVALGLLLAIERKGWATWALPRLLEMGQKGGGVLWATYLGARAHDSLGQTEQALHLYTLLTETYPDFVPGWGGLEAHQLAVSGSPISDEVLAVRAKRSRILREKRGGEGLEMALNEAGRLHLARKDNQAIKVLTEALAQGGENQSDARTFLGRLLFSQGSYSQAASEYAIALLAMPSDPGQPILREYLDTLLRATDESLAAEERIDHATVEVLLNVQAAHFPSDPLVPYEQAQLGLLMESRNPTLASDLVSTLFTRFRKATNETPLNDLRAGSAGDWARLLTQVKPTLAQEFISADLERHPGDIDLWQNYADLLSVRGEFDEERAMRESMVRMCPEANALQDLAWTLLRMGSPLQTVNSYLVRAQNAGGPAPQSSLTDRASFIRNLANLKRPDGRGIDRAALRNLQKLWAKRKKLRSVDLPILGRQYALGLLQHGEEKGLAELPQVLSELRALPQCDAYTKDFSIALAGLSQ